MQKVETPQEQGFSSYGLTTNTAKNSINIADILSGGVPKDGIPALNNPSFTTIEEAPFKEDSEGILVSFDTTHRVYPFAILVWHEIVNDKIGEKAIAVTFCPLCDSSIVFNRNSNDTTLTFGVSGLLYESNLLMYDTSTESLWSQALGRAVVGTYTGEELEILPAQRITLQELREKYPTAQVLNTNTGFNRSYGNNPYGTYLETDELYFPVTITDTRFPPKELMYVIPYNTKEKIRSFAIPYHTIKEGVQIFSGTEKEVQVERKGSEIEVTEKGKVLPGYFELWFSWATHHQEEGEVLRQK